MLPWNEKWDMEESRMFKRRVMKRIPTEIVGLGLFGHALALELAAAGADLVVLDKEEEKVRELREYTEKCLCGACTG